MRFAPILFLALAACADFPALDGTISDAARDAPYPTLQPVPEFGLNTAGNTVADADMTARIAALQARAERLRRFEIGALQ